MLVFYVHFYKSDFFAKFHRRLHEIDCGGNAVNKSRDKPSYTMCFSTNGEKIVIRRYFGLADANLFTNFLYISKSAPLATI